MDDGVTNPNPVTAGSEPPKAIRKPALPERVALSPKSVERLQGWLTQIGETLRGVRISKTELVNWVIEGQAANLSGPEMTRIEAEFFDELRFAEWAVRELKRARARGEKVTLQALMQGNRPNVRPVRASKAKVAASTKESNLSSVPLASLHAQVDGDVKVSSDKSSRKFSKNSEFSEKIVDFLKSD